MQTKTALVIASLVAVAGVFVAGRGEAGVKITETVTIDAAHKSFWGNMGSVRASADNVQNIGCQLTANTVAISANCFAKDAAGVSVSCSSTSPTIIQAVGSIGSGSTIVVGHDGAGTCTSIQAQNFSYFSTKVP